MKVQRFLSALVGMKSLFAGTRSAPPVDPDHFDLVLEMETLP